MTLRRVCVAFALVCLGSRLPAALAQAEPTAAPQIRRVAVLPLVPEDDTARSLAYVLADAVGRCLAANVRLDIPGPEPRARASRELRSSLLDATAHDPMRVAEALSADIVVHGWVRREGDWVELDVEIADVASGDRLVAQTFRVPRDHPLEAAVLLASRVNLQLLGVPLLSGIRELADPPKIEDAFLDAYGQGLADEDEADGATEAGARVRALKDACGRLAVAASLAPQILWPYEPLLRAASEVLLADPTLASAYGSIALARKALGDLPGAAAVLRAAAERLPQNAAMAVSLTDALLDLAAQSSDDRADLLREAVASAEKATLLDPSLPGAWVLLGAASFDSGNYGRAAEAYGRATGLHPMDAVTELGLGLSLARAGRWEEAKAHLDLVTRLDSGAYAERARAEIDKLGM